MPNTLTIVFTSAPSTEPVEFQNPNSPGVYVTGTQQANGTWQVIFTGVTKGTYAALTGRLKNYPAVTATIAASGPVTNIQQTAPAGTSASSSSATSISVTANSSANATAYRFLSATAQAGPYSVLVTQAAATYNHTGLTTGTVVWYEMQYVGGGFYDDSPPSVAFSGTATAGIVIVPAASDFTRSTINGAFGSLTGQRSPFARLYVTTDATSVTITQKSTITFANSALIGIFSGTTLATSVSTDTTGAEQTITVALPGSGSRLLRFQDGPTQQTNSTTNAVGGTTYRQLAFTGGTSATITAPPAPTSALVWVADSIGSGFAPTSPHVDSVTLLLESQLNYPVAVDGWGSRAVGITLNTAALQDACVARIAAVLNAPGITTKQVWIALGINDFFGFGNGSTAASVRLNLAQFMTKLQSNIAGVKIWLETPKYTTITYNATETFATYTTALQGAAADVAGVVSVNGLNLYDNNSTTLYSDSVHPNTLGHSQYAARAFAIISPAAALFPAVFTPSAGASFSGTTLSRTSTSSATADVWGVCTQQLFKGSASGLQGSVTWGSRSGGGKTIMQLVATTAEAPGANGSVPCYYVDANSPYYQVIKNPTPGFIFSPSPALTTTNVFKMNVYTDHVDYLVDGVIKYTETYTVAFPLTPKVFFYDQFAAIIGVQISGYLQATV